RGCKTNTNEDSRVRQRAAHSETCCHGQAPEIAHTRARGVVASEAGRRAVSEAYRRTSIARRDAHRLTLRPVSGLSSGSLRLRRIAFPHPSLRCSGSCDPLDLDYRCGGRAGFWPIRTGLPVYPSPRTRSQPSPRVRGNGHLTPSEACLRDLPAVKSHIRAARM